MPTISIQRRHKLEHKKAKAAAQKIAKDLQQRFDLQCTWDGDNVSFAVVREFNGNQFRINYKGKVSGDEMKISGEVVGMDRTFEMTAKRAK